MERPAVLKRLEKNLVVNGNFTRQLTLISAPAGFGKTTLARNWLNDKENRSAWYTLDRGDNEREKYWLYLASSLQTIESSLGSGTLEILRSSGLGSEATATGDTFLGPLLNELFALQEPLFLVIDDYHLINNSTIHQDMIFFIENLPPSIHLIVTTRSEPPWPLAKWRARGNMAEIRQKDLRFQRSETGRLLGKIEDVELSESQVQTLHDKTEGWVTGLQLAAISLSENPNKATFISSFAGSHRHVFNFLIEEVFSRQPAEVQEFLLETSILKRFCASLCDAVSDRKNSATLLAELERKNLFVHPLDEQGTWYRFHPMFKDLLLYRLKQTAPEKIDQLHQKAARWFLEAEEPGEAIFYALEGNNLEQAASMLSDHLETIVLGEGARLVLDYLDSFPEEVLTRYPDLAVHKAWFHLINRGRDEAEPVLEIAEKTGNRAEFHAPAEQKRYSGKLAVVKAYYNIYTRKYREALANAEKALELLPPDNKYWRAKVSIISGDARLFSGNPKDAYPYYREAHLNNQSFGNSYLTLSSGFKMATTLHYLGKLKDAEKMSRDLIQNARNKGLSKLPRTGLVWTLLGDYLRETGSLEEAERCIERGLLLSEPEKPAHGWNYLYRIALHYSKQEYEQTLAAINELEELHRETAMPEFILIPATAWKAMTLDKLNRKDEARHTLTEAGISEVNDLQGGQERGYLALARIMAADPGGEYNKVARLLENIEDKASPGENRRLLIETLMERASLEERYENREEAEIYLLKALQAGSESGYYQVYLDEKSKLLPVYQRISTGENREGTLLANSEIISFAAKIMQTLAGENEIYSDREGVGIKNHGISETPGKPANQEQTDPAKDHYPALIEELSSRELEILTLFSQGLSNQQIAQKIFLSPGTVKWHASNIYGKLGVRGRLQAVALARELKLIS